MAFRPSQVPMRTRIPVKTADLSIHQKLDQMNFVHPRKNSMLPGYWIGMAILVGLLVASILIVFSFLSIYGYFQLSEKIIPGVEIIELPVGGMSEIDAGILIHKIWNIERRISVYSEFNNLSVSPLILGIQVDPLATAKSALRIGRNGDLFSDIKAIYNSYEQGTRIKPLITFDQSTARNSLISMNPHFSKEAKNPTIRIENGKLVEVPGISGYTIDVDETLDAIQNNPVGILISGQLKIFTKPVPPEAGNLSELFEQAEKLLAEPVQIYAYDPVFDEQIHWSVSREDMAAWMMITDEDGIRKITFDENLARNYLITLNTGLEPERRLDMESIAGHLTGTLQNKEPLYMLIRHNPSTYTVKPGDTLLKIGWNLGMPYWKILEANPDLDPDNLWAGDDLIIPSKDELIPLPIVPGKRIKIDMGDQRLTVYQNGEQIKKYPISTGIDRSPTQPGIFQVQTHKRNAYASVWDLHMPNFLGIYEAWPGFMNGIHGLPTLANGQQLWANILGQPASYGCIILDTDAARWLYEWTENGVVVEIIE